MTQFPYDDIFCLNVGMLFLPYKREKKREKYFRIENIF